MTAQNPKKSTQSAPVFQLKENLNGRINNLALSPSYENTLIPLFEAISNAIHSIQEKYSDLWASKGKVTVQIIKDNDGYPTGFIIEDNGVGLNTVNFESFCTYDSSHKLTKGGKGVGRLTWLKVFDKIHIKSIFSEDNESQERSFDFALDNECPFPNYKLTPLPKTSSRTVVLLSGFKGRYKATCIKNTKNIAYKIIAHFLPLLITDEFASITIEDSDHKYDLKQIIKDSKHNQQSEDFEIQDIGIFNIQHVLLNKAVVEKAEHKIYLSAHGRIVTSHVINNQTGLSTYFGYDDAQVAYVGILSSQTFDENVTQERNNFDIDKEKSELIVKHATDTAKTFLKVQIDNIIEAKSHTVNTVLSRFPRYKYLVKDNKEFARSLPLNAKKEEDIYKAMSVYDYRENVSTQKKIKAVFDDKDDTNNQDKLDELYTEIIDKVSQQEKASLAEYIVKRKVIIDLLDKKLGYADEENKKKHKEDAVHKIFCPLRSQSGEVAYDQHNLWLLDDRLAFYDYWASDLSLKKFVENSQSSERPDIALFNGSNLYRRAGTDQPNVIVEFKRPARTEYSDTENPIAQVFGYIRELRSKRIQDKDGKLITQVGEHTPFFCYIVCDVTPKLIELLENQSMNNRLPGDRGFYGYNKSLNAYVEVLEYDQIVKDARLRHEAFFNKLGIN